MLRIRGALPEEDAMPLAALMTEFTGVPTPPDQMKARLRRSQNIEHPLIAEWDGSVVGFASLRLLHYLGEDVPYAELSELFVTEEYRHRGIARALIAEVEALARAARASSLTVLTGPENDSALTVYQGAGFEAFAIGLQKWFSDKRPYLEHTP